MPTEGQKPKLRDALWIGHYSVRGMVELVQARLAFAKLDMRALDQRNGKAALARQEQPQPSSKRAETIARIGYILPRLSARLPWRSDCLIQAIAGQNWLSQLGIPSVIELGVKREEANGLNSHAWLLCGGQIVLGSSKELYNPIFPHNSKPITPHNK